MKLSKLKKEFTESLSKLYPEEEVQSFFAILSETILKLSRLETVLQSEKDISEEDCLKFTEAVQRLKHFEPIQYITGETEFYGLVFKVNKHVLIPRPETEELVDWILKDIETQNLRVRTVLDIGTGSGCIAISLAKNLPNTHVSALDISEKALKTASQNAGLNQVAIHFYQQDILNSKLLPDQYDIIVSNPPYVRELEKEAMRNNVLKHEPSSALYVSNEDPLVFYHKIILLAKKGLAPKGCLYFEINEYLSKEMQEMLKEEGFMSIEIRKDIFGKNRMIKARKNA